MANQRITPFPFVKDLADYRLNTFRWDIMAAFSVALMALPQAMAYAFLAGLPLSAGIWAAVFGTIFAAAFGHSRFLVAGTTNTVAILIQSGTSEILYSYYRGIVGPERDAVALQIVLQIVLIVGIFQILAGLLRLGRLTQFTSRSVIIGYMGGAALTIIVTQLFPFFGIRNQEGYQPLYQQFWFFVTHFSLLHFTTAFIALASLGLLVFFYRASQKIPGPAIVFLIMGTVVALLGLSPSETRGFREVNAGEKVEKVAIFEDIGPVYSDLPRFKLPRFELSLLNKTLPLAFAITLISVLQVTAIGRDFTRSKEPPYDDNQEIFGIGVSNFFSAFLGAMPSAGGFSRSTLNRAAGAKTRFSAIYSGVFVFVIVILLGFLVTKIPLASLSALMLLTAFTMVNYRDLFFCLRATRSDAFVMVATFASSWIFTLDVALYVGVVLSIVLYLKQAAIPRLVEYAFNNVGKLRPIELEEERPDPRICIVQAEGELFFGAADQLQTKLREAADDDTIRVVILQLLNSRYIDASVSLALRQTYKYLQSTKRHFMISGISPEVWRVLQEAGLIASIGEENCFPANEQLPSEPTRAAYALAKTL